ncbi:Bug family tripartite tricarboxylate transporter substrate binding protein [Alicyclobacillus kakegawensis]|uniref:Bug family tripartite tricarboxylate transporter substrate binding protein n=1 Tax=Alicyclobacillus kakegawensis TaxID=392012 RepID=UPI00082A43FE|nr:tripartite tricarboxylate transporter substrate-binding protein [Alicyclobacillus kakegawensis]
MNNHKWLIISASVVALSVLAVGCGTSGKTSNSGATGEGATGSQKNVSTSHTESATSASAFFKDKTMQILVPYGPGGGYDQWARLIAPYLQEYLGLGKVEVVNVPGGGGIVGTNQIYSAKPDGLTIGDTNAGGDVFDQIDNTPGVNFDVTKLTWIGRPDDDPHILGVHTNGPYKSFTDLEHAQKTIKALATGKGSSDYNAAVITLNAFNIPYTMVAAFSGSKDEKASFLSGNGDTISLSASDIAEIPDQAKVILLQSTERFKKLPNVPTVIELAQQAGLNQDKINALKEMAKIMDLGHAFIAPPGIPADRVAALRKAFQKALSDPSFIAQAKKENLYVGYLSGSELTNIADNAVANTSHLKPLLQAK